MPNWARLAREGSGLWGWLRIAVVIGTVLLAWGKMESRVAAAEKELDRRGVILEDLRWTIGALQLDIAKMCAAQFGIDKCETAGRPARHE